MNKQISQLFDYGGEIEVNAAPAPFDPKEIREMTMNKIHNRQGGKALRLTGRSLLIAAVITGLLTITAFAAGLSIHQRRQDEIRESLEIEEHHVADYAEPETPEEPGSGVTVLSVINTGDSQGLYLNVSPVEPEDVRDAVIEEENDGVVRSLSYCVTWNENDMSEARIVTRDWDFAQEDLITEENMPWGAENYQHPSREAMVRKYLEQGYDPETKTLTLRCGIPNSVLDLSGPVTLHLICWEMRARLEPVPGEEGVCRAAEESAEIYRDYGFFTFDPVTEHSSRIVWFPEPVEFENPELGGTGRFLGVELQPTKMYWILDCEAMNTICTPEKRRAAFEADPDAYHQLEISWVGLLDRLEREASMTFSDGTVLRQLNGETSHFGEDGWLYDEGWYPDTPTIDIDAVESVTICGVTIPLS